jgi:hypothetical protein
MTVRRSVFMVVALVGLLMFSRSAYGQEQAEVDKVVKDYLATQKTEQEEADAQASAVGDLNGDGKPEIVLVWTQLGPTYSSNNLTVFSKTAAGYKAVTTFPLKGEAELSMVKGGIISINQKVLAKGDPLCCPSVKKLGKYRLVGKRIVEVKR